MSAHLNACLPEGYVAMPDVQFNMVTDVVEAFVYNQAGGLSLAGAIELVSPANKDRAAHREAFVSKCETYLQQGVGLLIVDIVTDRSSNLHDQLLKRLEDPAAVALDSPLYAASYHPVERDDEDRLDVWQQVLEVGKRLPKMPLWLKGGLCLPVELDATYERTCRDLRIDEAR